MGSEEEEGRIERLEQDAEREARSLEKDAEELGERIKERQSEWTRKRRDGSVAGPRSPDETESDDEGGEATEEAGDD